MVFEDILRVVTYCDGVNMRSANECIYTSESCQYMIAFGRYQYFPASLRVKLLILTKVLSDSDMHPGFVIRSNSKSGELDEQRQEERQRKSAASRVALTASIRFETVGIGGCELCMA